MKPASDSSCQPQGPATPSPPRGPAVRGKGHSMPSPWCQLLRGHHRPSPRCQLLRGHRRPSPQCQLLRGHRRPSPRCQLLGGHRRPSPQCQLLGGHGRPSPQGQLLGGHHRPSPWCQLHGGHIMPAPRCQLQERTAAPVPVRRGHRKPSARCWLPCGRCAAPGAAAPGLPRPRPEALPGPRGPAPGTSRRLPPAPVPARNQAPAPRAARAVPRRRQPPPRMVPRPARSPAPGPAYLCSLPREAAPAPARPRRAAGAVPSPAPSSCPPSPPAAAAQRFAAAAGAERRRRARQGRPKGGRGAARGCRSPAAAMATSKPLSRFWEWGRNIVCVGRNYAEHAKEMGSALPREPLFFLKPSSAYVREGSPILRPYYSSNLHHEVELGVVIGKRAQAVPQEAAMEHVAGYALCLDMTARDTQEECKRKGLPWTLAKGFRSSCPVSDFVPKEKIPDPHKLKIWLKVNGKLRQEGETSSMIFSIPYLISYISEIVTLEEGDLILTGSPKGVGAVEANDEIEAGISDVLSMRFKVAQQQRGS